MSRQTPVLMCNTDRLRLRSTECMRWRQKGGLGIAPGAPSGLTKCSTRLGGQLVGREREKARQRRTIDAGPGQPSRRSAAALQGGCKSRERESAWLA